MHWLNPKIEGKTSHFIYQTLLILGFVFIIMVILITVEDQRLGVLSAIGASSLASSAFICFGMPQSPTAKLYRLLLSYFVAIIMGVIFHNLPDVLIYKPYIKLPVAMAISAALSVALTMFVLTLFDWGHPPAMGLSLGLVVVQWDYGVLITVIIALALLCMIRVLLQSWFDRLV